MRDGETEERKMGNSMRYHDNGNSNRGKIIGDAPCPSCKAMGRDRTGNHLILFDNGGSYCNRCGYTASRHDESVVPGATHNKNENMNPSKESLHDILQYPIRSLQGRGISQATCEYFGVRVAVSESDGSTQTRHYYPAYKDGHVVGFKVRVVEDKQFFSVGTTAGTELFGQNQAKAGSKTLYITEGECDAMALFQSLREHSTLVDWYPSVVSVPHGAKSSAQALANQFDFVSSFDKLVFVFDNDDAGKEGLQKACQILPAKSYIVNLPLKDPNEMLLAGRSEELKWLCMKPKQYQPDNIVNGAEAWEAYIKNRDQQCIPYPETWSELNKRTYGVRPGSIVTVASGSGCGKTQFLRELKYWYHNTTDYKMADIALEEGLGDTIGGMLALHLNKRIQLPDVKCTEEEEKSAFDHIYGAGRWSLYDHFGGMDDNSLFAKIRYFAATGHKIIFLDHLSIIVSEYAAEGGERERIDTIMTKLAKIVKEFGIIIFLVVHLKKTVTAGQSFEEGLRPSLDDLRGSGAIKQLSWDVIFLTRNQQHPDQYCANTSLVTVGKCRFTGRTGDADYLHFDDKTGRMIKVEPPHGWDVKELKKKEERARF